MLLTELQHNIDVKKLGNCILAHYKYDSSFVNEPNTPLISGLCGLLAYFAGVLHPNATVLTTDEHAWVFYNGKHYDFSKPEGVKRHQDLPSNSSNEDPGISPPYKENGSVGVYDYTYPIDDTIIDKITKCYNS